MRIYSTDEAERHEDHLATIPRSVRPRLDPLDGRVRREHGLDEERQWLKSRVALEALEKAANEQAVAETRAVAEKPVEIDEAVAVRGEHGGRCCGIVGLDQRQDGRD